MLELVISAWQRALARLAPALALLAAAALAPCPRATAQGYSEGYYRPPPESFYRGARMRFGAESDLGGTVGYQGGFGAGVTIAAGLQLNDIIATFAQHRLFLASAIDGSEGGLHAESFNSFVFELTLFELLQIGAGPSLDFGVGGLCPPSRDESTGRMVNEASCSGATGPYAGIDVRLAVAISERSRARRRGLSVGFHLHSTWIARNTAEAITITLAVGFILH